MPILALLALLAHAGAPAAGPESGAAAPGGAATMRGSRLVDEAAWRDAERLLQDFHYEEALVALAPLTDDETLSAVDRARVLVRVGAIQADLRREDEARRSLAAALALDDDASLPAEASPRLRALFAQVRAARPRATSPTTGTPGTTTTTTGTTGTTGTGTGTTTTGTTTTATTTATAAKPNGTTTGSAQVVEKAASADAGPAVDPVRVALWTTTIGGGVAVAGGAALWAAGLALYAAGDAATFQQDAADLGEAGAWSQAGGQLVVGVGVVALAVGAGGLWLAE